MIVVNRIYKDTTQEEGISIDRVITVNDDQSGLFRWLKTFDGHQINSIKVEETVSEVAYKMMAARAGTPF